MDKNIAAHIGNRIYVDSEKGTSADLIIVGSIEEKWSIIGSGTKDGDGKELCTIKIKFENKSWGGSIQDFFAIQAITNNAFKAMREHGSFSTDQHEATLELESLLSHFK